MTGISSEIESILAAGNQAPSGENCQPWKFIVRGTVIEVHLDAEKDASFYNWGQRASYMACGAVVENITIASSALGFRPTVNLFPSADPFLVATIELWKDQSAKPDELNADIFLRTTNRKEYLRVKLSDSEKQILMREIDSANTVALHFAEERNDVDRLAMVGSANEEIMLSNQELHNFFFSHLNWTKEEDEAKKSGFYIKTLELPPPAKLAFYVLKNWSIMKQLISLNFHKVVGKQNASTYAHSAAIGALSVASNEPRDFVQAGRVLQRLWLRATRLGLSIQPLTGIFFFKLKIDGGEGNVFSDDQRAKIESEYKTAKQILGVESRNIVFMFRIGSGAAPSARSSRFSLDQVVTVAS